MTPLGSRIAARIGAVLVGRADRHHRTETPSSVIARTAVAARQRATRRDVPAAGAAAGVAGRSAIGASSVESCFADVAQPALGIALEAAPHQRHDGAGGVDAGTAANSGSRVSTAASVSETSSPSNARLPDSIS